MCKVEIAIHVQPMIVSHYDRTMIAGETLAVIGKKIMAAAAGKSSAVHVDHDRTLTGAIDLLCPKIEAQAVLAGDRGGRATMQHERVFVRVGEVFPVSIKVRRVLVRAHASILQRVANSLPGFGLDWRHEALRASCGGTIGHTFENVHPVPLEAADFPSGCFGDRCRVRGNDRAASVTACCEFSFRRVFRPGLDEPVEQRVCRTDNGLDPRVSNFIASINLRLLRWSGLLHSWRHRRPEKAITFAHSMGVPMRPRGIMATKLRKTTYLRSGTLFSGSNSNSRTS